MVEVVITRTDCARENCDCPAIFLNRKGSAINGSDYRPASLRVLAAHNARQVPKSQCRMPAQPDSDAYPRASVAGVCLNARTRVFVPRSLPMVGRSCTRDNLWPVSPFINSLRLLRNPPSFFSRLPSLRPKLWKRRSRYEIPFVVIPRRAIMTALGGIGSVVESSHDTRAPAFQQPLKPAV